MASKYAALTITAPASAATLSSLLETAASPITAGYRKLVMQCDPANTASAKVLIGGSDVALSPQACGKVLQSGDVYIYGCRCRCHRCAIRARFDDRPEA